MMFVVRRVRSSDPVRPIGRPRVTRAGSGRRLTCARWIAALAVQHDLVLCTSDRHFRQIPQLVIC